GEIKKSKSNSKKLASATGLPLPLMNEGDENMFFCYLCNYRHRGVSRVLNHGSRRHNGFMVKTRQILEYTSLVLKEDSPGSASSSVKQTQRNLKCHRCSFTTQYVYLLRRHMWTGHRTSPSTNQVLRRCFHWGMLEPGYHCDLCVFSHNTAAVLYKHYQTQHPEHEGDGIDGSSPSQRVGQSKNKSYSCRACSFRGHSLSSIEDHYRAVHPWTVKEDGSVLNVITSKESSANTHVDEMPESFDIYQVPLEFEKSLDSSCEGAESPTGISEILNEEQVKIQALGKIYKCPYCAYVNTNHKGFVTHFYMMHPTSVFREDRVDLDEAHLSGLRRKDPSGSLTFRGYMCQTCPQIHTTLQKLNKHRENDHAETGPNTDPDMLKGTPKPSARGKIQKSNTHSTRGSILTPSFLHKNIYTVVRCQYCRYKCKSKLALFQHVRVHHQNISVPREKCVLCSKSYLRGSWLKSHYLKEHGKAAYLKYGRAISKKVPENSSLDSPLNQQPKTACEVLASSTTSEEGKILVYRCPRCAYVNASLHGMLTHCQMRHPTLVARAERLKTGEILVKNMVGCTMGKVPNNMAKTASEERTQYKCKTCPSLTFDSSHLLIDHYSTFHCSDWKLDFTMLSEQTKSNAGVFQCAHCNKHIYGVRNLRRHLDRHSASERKMATASKALFVTPTPPDTTSSEVRMQNESPHTIIYVPISVTCLSMLEALKVDWLLLCLISSSIGRRKCPSLTVWTKSRYLEPPDVQRQLNHYGLMAQTVASQNTNQQEAEVPDTSLLHCEFCNFSTGHLSSIRRHYLNRHGKKILRCKDCDFFTSLRKTLEMHIEMGHSAFQSKPTHHKDIRCPFCLYQTKNKNNMIDHIVLHREERVVPIEVRRPKLSRYLQGIVFRCHKCTFTSGSAENLRLHTMRHDDIKPYKCRLCYFNCTQLSNLEAHLTDKHQVLRNLELVGEVSLEQLEARVGRMPEEEEQPLNPEDHISAFIITDEAAEVLPPSAMEKKPFTCELCGRSFMNSSELKSHIMRHGM
uniref:Zinc finger protein 462-like n=1 Tax=Echeneis naucrates TaxID=173247 RepID=A0A665WE35_ECHNA